ncbi:lipase family protein [Actinoplanes sp. DH11]|uniref:lipase family protein n=1 Tax=Actinoplanes sp. DH11 TaxID=2857011 RepID=UPI001E44931C|nr:lipase family protein [Actinoplanes sp. DH11]
MSSRPVFVVHGISNRSRSLIEERVTALREASLGRWRMYPTYWGDLGAADLGVELVMPESRGGRPVRGDLPPGEVRGPDLPPGAGDGLVFVLDAVAARLDAPPDHEVRGAVPPHVADEARAAIAEFWPETGRLRDTGDPALLTEVAAALAAAVVDELAEDEHAVRDPGRIRRVIGRRLPELDRVAGAALASAGERFYTWFRTRHAEYVARTLGDILVYQRHGEQIRERVRQEIRAAVPGAGETAATAVHLVGHSLGAVIALDLALDPERPVHTAGLVTFGCQWPLFHIVDPRERVGAYRGERLPLPDTIARWTNLWHPLDPLGFVAGRIFDGPQDVRVEHLLSEQLYAHSVYWTRPELVDALFGTFGEESPTAQ